MVLNKKTIPTLMISKGAINNYLHLSIAVLLPGKSTRQAAGRQSVKVQPA
jgi:hypothetical protein